MARLSDIVRRGGQQPGGPPREVSTGSRRLSDLLRRRLEPASPPPDRGPPPAPCADSGPVPDQPSSLPKPDRGSPRLEDFEAASRVLQAAVETVEDLLETARNAADFPIAGAGKTVESLLQNLETGDALLVPFFAAGGLSRSPAREAVNVCILSLKMGLELGYAPEELYKLGLAALLADIGTAWTPREVVGMREPLAAAERALVETHRRDGAKRLRQLGPQYAWLAEVVEKLYQKAERPRHSEDRMDEYAAIIRLAGLYASLVHRRPFRGPLEGLGEILQRERATLPDRILKALIRSLSMFPVGSLVRLNTGEIARVVRTNKDVPLRPVVALVVRRGSWLEEPVVVDLRQSPLHQIEDSVAEEALP
ncbi:MAG: hypothetical protein HY726_20120 [Candidatus Rokubacteria bacterium]|nr:hypothetical protein [Candidatus Rokubacteria bacterium]